MLSRFSKIGGTLAAFAMAVLAAAPAWAQDAANAGADTGHWLSTSSVAVLSAALAIAIGTIGPGLAQGNAIARAMEAIGRNPECAGKVQSLLLIGLAFVESLCIYALVIAFLAIGKV